MLVLASRTLLNTPRNSYYLKVKRTAKLGFWKLAVAPLPFMIYFRAMLILVPHTVPRILPLGKQDRTVRSNDYIHSDGPCRADAANAMV